MPWGGGRKTCTGRYILQSLFPLIKEERVGGKWAREAGHYHWGRNGRRPFVTKV